MEKKDDYRFMQIRDAITSINQKVSFIGVITEFAFPKKSRGTDWFCSLKVIDQSHIKLGISVNIFSETPESLPRVASVGDIIMLSHVVIKSHNGEVNAVFNKKFSSFALYEGKDGQYFRPYQSSSRFRPRDLDSKFITGLRKWLIDFHLDDGPNSFSLLKDVKDREKLNIVCKILHVYEDAKTEWTAFIWDGTDIAASTINTKLEDEKDNPLPLQLEPLPLPRDVLCRFPTVGTILRVIIEKGYEKHALHFLNAGKWLKFIDILCEVHAGLWRGVLTRFTKLRCTSEDDSLVLARQSCYNERLSFKLGRIPYWSFPWCSELTEVDYDHAPFVTLMDVMTYSEVTSKFKCIVRVVAAFPYSVEDFCSCHGTYRIRLTIEDPTSRIHAFLYAEDGEKFFGGYPSIDVLTRKRNKLLGVAVNDIGGETDAPRNPPWVQCCIKSYYLDASDVWGSRHYRIFGTKNVG
ncbi:hypothetical protein K2173_027160 [Erythroxylum novogranatense]|uniref:Telomeric single stranded DNA binding POT1/Cdc13 domain-containing protein n=1 Tax=Erythroxylum novogranatense TaxID=1862640 RepID=A0AAV8U0V4_9ROSI|nr:hypothetical protein K2173_027160 [Erythroxylum novogranatense]